MTSDELHARFADILVTGALNGSRTRREAKSGSKRTVSSRRGRNDGGELRDTQVNFRTTKSFNDLLKAESANRGVSVSAFLEAAANSYIASGGGK